MIFSVRKLRSRWSKIDTGTRRSRERPSSMKNKRAEEDQDLADAGVTTDTAGCTKSSMSTPTPPFWSPATVQSRMLLKRRERPLEHVQFFLDVAADFRRLADPVHHRRRQQHDDAVEHADHQQPQHDWPSATTACRGAPRAPTKARHHGHDEGGCHRQQHRLGQVEGRDQHDDENAGIGDCAPPSATLGRWRQPSVSAGRTALRSARSVSRLVHAAACLARACHRTPDNGPNSFGCLWVLPVGRPLDCCSRRGPAYF